MKYYLTPLKINIDYELSPQTFFVEELVDWNKLGFDHSKGEYVVLEIRKSMMDTFQALSITSRLLGIPRENIIHLGLKDKYASATQFFFVKRHLFNPSAIREIRSDKISINPKGFVNKKPRKKDLLGNRFLIKLGYVADDEYSKIKEIVGSIREMGLPNYYGYQRFGLRRPNTHLIGLYYLTGRLNELVRSILRDVYYWEDRDVIDKRIRGHFKGLTYESVIHTTHSLTRALSRINDLLHGIYVEAYIAYLFNQLLNKVIELKGWTYLDNSFPTAGCKEAIDIYRDLLEIDCVEPSSIPPTMCWSRNGLIKPEISVEFSDNYLNLSFSLARGTYATVVLREFFKERLKLS